MKRQILISSIILLFVAGFATARTIHVPGAYPYIDIQRAINIANPGDVIVLAPGTYIGTGYSINKGITITGTNPNNPYVVAATVIDFDGHLIEGGGVVGADVGQDVTAFILSGSPTTLRGITIANSYRGSVPVSDGVKPGDNGFNQNNWFGGSGINIYGNHIISNCIIRNCGLIMMHTGGNGADGGEDPQSPDAPPVNPGGNGGRGGSNYGAGIYIGFGSPQILNTEINDCIVVGGAGGAAGIGLDAAPPDQNFFGGRGGNGANGGNAMGAGVYCASGNPTFRNCIVRNCQVRAGDGSDGAIGGNGAIEEPNALFPGGRGGDGGVPGFARGAGVYCDNGVNPTFTDCQFIGNRAYGGNGGDGADAGDVHLAMLPLAGGIGGLVEQSYSPPGTPQGGNPPSDYSALGAGVYIEHGDIATFTGCTFKDNATRGSVSGLGGFPSNGNREQPRINYPIPSYGAGIYSVSATTIFTDCNIQDNWTTQEPNQYQGDLYPYGSGVTNLDFQYAEAEYIGYGGGMCFIGGALGAGNFGYVDLNNCNISDNNAPVGGGVCASALTHFHVDECNFANNLSYLGGGLFSIDNLSTISKSTFSGNRAYDLNAELYGLGGGIFCFSSDVRISDCTISENTTNGYGAGICMSGEVLIPPLTAEPVLKNCLLNDNKAGLDGGGIYCDWGTKPTIINSTITGNEAKGDPPFGVGYGGGLYCSYESNVNIINSIVWGNAGPNTIGPELAVETWFGFNPTVLTVSYCDVEGGEGEMWVDGSSTLNWGTGNIDADPLFVDTDINEPTYYLSQVAAGQLNDSPCVNVGSNTAANLGMNTLTTRTDNVPDAGIVDLGYHYMAGTTIEYQLDIDVLTFDPNVGANGRLMAQADGDNPFEISDPDIRQVSQGTVVFLTAIPDPDYRVWYWEGTDDDTSKALTNTVTMNSDKKVFVAFEPDGKYYLFVKVKGEGTVAINPNPNTLLRSPGEVVTLTATPANPSDAIIWTGTDNDNTVGITNTVTMTGRKEVTVEFYTPRILYVGSDSGYPTLQAAIDAAHDMDVIQLMPSGQPYFTQDGYQIIGRNITITSVDPYDPAVVETTVIQQQVSPPASRPPAFAFYFVGPQMRVLGITIRGFSAGNYTMVDPEAPLYDGLHGITVPARGIQCYSASPTFINCVIDDCHSYGDNGSNGRGGDTGHINGGNGGWPGGAWGGAVYCGEYYIGYPSNPTFIGCTFSNNSAIGGNGADGGSGASPPNTGRGGKGGGWYYGYELPSPWESPPGGLPKDHSGLGGAVFIDSDCSPTFEDCNFINNSSHGGLNGICGQDPPSNDREEPSIRYRIDNLGGAVYMKAGSAPTFTTCTFTDNTADTNKSPASFDDFLGFGGAVAMENGAKPTFVGCMFNNNISDIGGGMYSARSEPEITESNFIANTAYHGGGMLLIDGIAHITASLFSGNNANRPGSEGGAITVLGANAKIIDCSIYDNNSSGSGGGVYLSSKYFDGNESADGNSVLLKNCLIVGNTAVQNGGGVSANWHSEPNIVNCTIADNDAAGMGGGVYGGFNNYTNIINTILWDNFAPSGPQMAVGTTSAPSYMKVTYSDVQGGPGLVRVDPGSTLEWDVALDNPDYPTNIHADPLFVTGPRGYFYLSQVGAGQAQTSPCVDTGSAPAGNLGFTLYTTRTDESPDRGIVDMGYHFPILEECRFAETVKDGVVDLLDLAVLVDKWLNTSCGDANEWCGGADLSFDTTVDFDDYAILAGCWMAYDSIPPIPNPAQWEVEPYVLTSTSVNMKAVTEQDVLWGLAVDYNFVCESGNCHTSGWRAGREYNDVGLVPDVEYSYKIKARDVAGNETEWSTIRFVTTTTGPGPDTTPPTPNPMTWQIAPHSINPTTIEMKATIATDASGGIEYEFNEANGTALDSGWRADPCYTVTGLDPNSTYCFNVRAHDKYGNATAWSANGCVSPGVVVDVNAPTPAPSIVWSPDVNYITWVEPNTVSGQFMYTSPETEDGRWWHRVIANVAGITDDSGGPVEIRFICTTDSAYSSKNKVKTGGVSIPIYVGQPVAIGSRAVKWRVTYSNSGNYIVYEVDVDKFGGSGKKLFWRVCAYDAAGNSSCSDVVEISWPPVQ